MAKAVIVTGVLFTSDLHLGHKNIIQYCHRNATNCGVDFETIEEMDNFLIRKWNMKVNDDDEVYILGDFSFRSSVNVESYLQQMQGKKHLILGNHDSWQKNMKDMSEYFESVSNMEVIKLGKKIITLCHYPLLQWYGSRKAFDQGTSISWLIHGHLHNNREGVTYEFIRDNLTCALNASVDINNYEPVTFEELLENNNKWYGRIN